MTNLIKITPNPQGGDTVSARELHEFLEVKTDFTTWCDRMFEWGFVEGVDYVEVFPKIGEKSRTGRPEKDYAFTIQMAKEIAMIQRSHKGKQARLYFIACEEESKKLRIQSSLPPRQLTWLLHAPEKIEIDYRTPIYQLHRYYRKPLHDEPCEYLNIYEMVDFTRAFSGKKINQRQLKSEIEAMGFEEGCVEINGRPHWGYMVVITFGKNGNI